MRASPLYLIQLLLTLALAACGGSDSGASSSSSADTAQGVDATAADSGGADVGTDVSGPPCANTSDCQAVFVGLQPCERAVCIMGDPASAGRCVREKVAEGEPCAVGDLCVLAAECDAGGGCVATSSVECAERVCQEALGCTKGECAYAPIDGAACDDGDSCTADDRCAEGVCTAGSVLSGCNCARDADCLAPADACQGQPACVEGRCGLLPVGGVVCDSPSGGCTTSVCEAGSCAQRPAEGGTCSDGNLCTTKDTCTPQGACEGTPGTGCGCVSDADCAAFEDQDLCNGVLVCTEGYCTVAPQSVVTCPAPEGACQKSVCEPSTGVCLQVDRADGVTCNDGDACTLGERCVAGQCVSSQPATCGPPTLCGGAPCHPSCLRALECQEGSGCPADHEWLLTGTPCDDGDPCAREDVCNKGLCVPGPVALTCAADGLCETASCVAGIGCVTTAIEGPCEDGDPCTVGDQCAEGSCAPGAPKDCEDNNVCTTGYCAPGAGCTLVNNTSACDDGDPCTTGDRCQAGQCKPGPKSCPCNEDSDCGGLGGGTCLGVGHCIDNQCALDFAAATPCVSGDACSPASCQFATGLCKLSTAADGSVCDDGSTCTTNERCAGGLCVGAPEACDDGDPCTTDVCAPGAGCQHLPATGPCDDGDACTKNDTCGASGCSGVGACDCLSDADCDEPASACAARVRCVSGLCKPDPSTAVVCPNFGPCLTSSCVASTGACAFQLRSDGALCSDGDVCTSGDSCLAGACVGRPLDCDDGSVCTSDSCGPAGCVNVPHTGACNDGDPCTADERCSAGVCVGTRTLCAEDCASTADLDGDGLVGCADPDCAAAAACSACALATPLSCGSLLSGAIADGAPSQVGLTSCGDGPLADKLYRFSTTTTGKVDLGLTKGADTHTLRVLTTTPGGGCEPGGCKALGPAVSFTAVAGAVYTVVVEKLFLGAAPSFTLRADCATACVPACTNKSCGDNGCGGSCGSCADNDPCTLDACVAGACVFTPIPGCCVTSDTCTGGTACAPAYCDAGKCKVAVFPGCCLDDSDCYKAASCATASCQSGVCVPVEEPGCCASAADCADGDPCTVNLCVAGSCAAAPIPGCCVTEADCPPAKGCNVPACLAGQCVAVDLTAGGTCCVQDVDCTDANPCTRDVCQPSGAPGGSGQCIHSPVAGCCKTDQECPAVGGGCARSRCVDAACTLEAIPGCCAADADCAAFSAACSVGRCVAGACAAVPLSGCCLSDGQCGDGDACTVDRCVAGTCSHAKDVECCSTPFQCDDGDSCTLDGCHDGRCRHDLVQGCCAVDGDCDDGVRCSSDRCVKGGCVYAPIPGCCTSADDCSAGSCVSSACVGGRCVAAGVGACCDTDASCASANPCESGICVAGVCQVSTLPGCCTTDEDCPTSADACGRPRCVQGQCTVEQVPACCAATAACGGASATCSIAECLGRECVEGASDACCAVTADCVDPGIGCNTATCAAGACAADAASPACCLGAPDCPTADTCSESLCQDNLCEAQPVAGCCTGDADCASTPHGACAAPSCVLGRCVAVPVGAGCCETVADCPAPSDHCFERDCVANACVSRPVEGCCATADDCEPVTGCQVAACRDGRCQPERVPGCCDGLADCALDHVCATSACEAAADPRCVAQRAPGCCVRDHDCPAPANPCSVMICQEGACVEEAVTDCCVADNDCAGEGLACSAPRCLAGHCVDVGVAGCCVVDADCPEDSNACLQAVCVAGGCALQPRAECCTVDGDCADGGGCSTERCVAGRCEHGVAPNCPGGACLHLGFEATGGVAPTLSGGLALGFAGALGGAADARVVLAPSAIVPATLTTPAFDAGPSTSLRFAYRLDVPYGDCSAGSLRVEVLGSNDTVLGQVYQTCARASSRVDQQASLAAYAGLKVRVRIVVAPAPAVGTVSAALDDVNISGCTLPCAGVCDDGNPCTTDVCVAGLCTSSPIASCCSVAADCDDQSPCTTDSCTATGCAHELVAPCPVTSCLSEGFVSGAKSALVLDPGGFVPASSGSLTPGGHLALVAGAQHLGQTYTARLPRISSSGVAAVRLAVRKTLGPFCELGKLSLRINGEETSLGCGSHDWRSVSVALPTSGDAEVALVFTVYQPGALVEVDDLVVSGACALVECAAAADCDDGLPCTLDRCDVGRHCLHEAIPECCSADPDCQASSACVAAHCVEGRCQESVTPGCTADTCAFWGFDEQGGSLALSSADSTARPISVARVVVGSPSTALSLRLRTAFGVGAACEAGALTVFVGDEVVAMECGTASWSWVTVPLAAYVGRVLEVSVRVTAPSNGGDEPLAWLDELRVTGACAAAECAKASDCPDLGPCTDQVCQGLRCLALTNTQACDDETACTTDDRCVGGACHGRARACSDGNPCTDDTCRGEVGCVFAARAGACDDGRVCSAGDTCRGGVCVGSALGCRDFNPCTRDSCAEPTGCRFEPEPFGTPCEGGVCWEGVCSSWELIQGGALAATAATLYEVAQRSSPVPLLVGGATADGHGVVVRVDEGAASVSSPTVFDSPAEIRALVPGFAVGGDRVVALGTGHATVLDVEPGVALYAAALQGQNLFVAGDGSAFGRQRSTLHRCKVAVGDISGKCQRMAVVSDAAHCGRQVTFHSRSLLAGAAPALLIGGASVEGGNTVARVAYWDGNTASTCDALPVHSGRAYTNGALALRVDRFNDDRPEWVTALAAHPWGALAVGTSGLVADFDGAGWTLLHPTDFVASRLWSDAFDVADVAIDGDSAHLVGDGVGTWQGGCRDGFYAHAQRVGGAWRFDALTPLPKVLQDCKSPPPRALLHVAAAAVDGLTRDLILTGQAPLQGGAGPFVLRLRRP